MIHFKICLEFVTQKKQSKDHSTIQSEPLPTGTHDSNPTLNWKPSLVLNRHSVKQPTAYSKTMFAPLLIHDSWLIIFHDSFITHAACCCVIHDSLKYKETIYTIQTKSHNLWISYLNTESYKFKFQVQVFNWTISASPKLLFFSYRAFRHAKIVLSSQPVREAIWIAAHLFWILRISWPFSMLPIPHTVQLRCRNCQTESYIVT